MPFFFLAVQFQFFPLLLKLIAWNGERYALSVSFFHFLAEYCFWWDSFSWLFQSRETIFVHSSVDDFSRVISSSFPITFRSAMWDLVINFIEHYFQYFVIFNWKITHHLWFKKKVVGMKSIILRHFKLILNSIGGCIREGWEEKLRYFNWKQYCLYSEECRLRGTLFGFLLLFIKKKKEHHTS